jgi:hypothetical protein
MNAKALYINAKETFDIVKNQAQSDVDLAKLTLKFAQLDLRKYNDPNGEYRNEQVKANIKSVNPDALILDAASPIVADDPELIKGKRVWLLRTDRRSRTAICPSEQQQSLQRNLAHKNWLTHDLTLLAR